jgi:hypothetical protein
MSRYEREQDGATHLWVIERRAANIFMREGKAGGKGRIHSFTHAGEAEAIAAMERDIAMRLADGWILTDEKAIISSPFRSRKQLDRAKRAGSATGLGLDVSEILRRLEARLAATLAAGRVPLESIIAHFAEASALSCTWRLIALEYASNEDGSRVDLQARFGQGSGSNPDAYDFDGYAIAITLPPSKRDDLEDEIILDEFADGMRLAASTLAKRFLRALDDLDAFSALRAVPVVSAETRRVDG